jgi:hypothetical protein
MFRHRLLVATLALVLAAAPASAQVIVPVIQPVPLGGNAARALDRLAQKLKDVQALRAQAQAQAGGNRIVVNGMEFPGARTVTIINGQIFVDGVEVNPNTMPGRKAVGKDEVFGKVVGVDTGDNAITMKFYETGGLVEKLFKLAPGARVLLDGKEGSLADIGSGCDVQVRLSDNPRRALEVSAQGPTVRAALRTVDADKKTLTVADGAGSKTFEVADDAAVTLNNAVAKLADLKPNSSVSLQLSADGKTVRKVAATGGRTTLPGRTNVPMPRGVDPTLPADFDRGFFPDR